MKTITLNVLLVFIVAVRSQSHLVKHVLEGTDRTIKGISKVVTGGLLGGVNFNFHGQVEAMSNVQPSEQTTRRSGLFGLSNLFHHQPPKPQEQRPEPEHQNTHMGYGHYHHGHHRPPPHYGGGQNGGNYGNNQYGAEGNRPNNQYGHHGGQQPLQEYNPNGPNTPNNQANGQYGPPGEGPGYPTQPNTPHNQYGQGSSPYNPPGQNYGHRPPPENNHYGHPVNANGQNYGHRHLQENNPVNGNQPGNNGNQPGNNDNQQGNQGIPGYQNNNGVQEPGPVPQKPRTESPKGGNDVALTGDQYVYGADGIKVKEPGAGADQDVDDFSIDIRVASDKE